MPAFHFPTNSLLQRLLREGELPGAVAIAPVHFGKDSSGREWLAPFEPLEPGTVQYLERNGVLVRNTDRVELHEILPHWFAALPLEAIPFRRELLEGEFLFVVPPEPFPAFARELQRLRPGEYLLSKFDEETDQPILIRLTSPPYYLLSQAIDAEQGIQAYVEATPGIWVEFLFQQPLLEVLPVAKDQWRLIRSPRVWQSISPPVFQPTAAALNLTLPFSGMRGFTRVKGKLALPLRLQKQREVELPELWILPGDAQELLQPLIENADERTLERFQFACCRRGEQSILLLRVLKAKGPQPVWILPGEAYRNYLKLGNFFLPVRMRLETVPRRELLRQLLQLEREHLVWIESKENTPEVHSIPLSAFQPLRNWVQFAIELPTRRLASPRLDPFAELDSFTVHRDPREPKPAEEPKPKPEKIPPAPQQPRPPIEKGPGLFARTLAWLGGLLPIFRSRSRSETEVPVESISVETAVRNAIRPMEERLRFSDASKITQSQENLSVLESRFLESLAGRSKESMDDLWEQLAPAYEKVDNLPDAILCWINAVWERRHAKSASVDLLNVLAYGWFRAEAKQASMPNERIDLARWLNAPPRPELIRALGAFAFWGSQQPEVPETLRKNLDAVQALLEQYESWLPLRGAWLVRTALARLSGQDVLGLARTRDRLLERLLAEGLSLDLDTPSFLRFASEGVSQRFQHVRDWIIKKRESIHDWIKKFNTGGRLQQFGVDAEVHNTHGYVELLLAWGLARFGEQQACDRLRNRASKILQLDDPVHRFLHTAFEFRIQQVREGKPIRGPLPPELMARFRQEIATRSENDKMVGEYAVEKCLEYSEVLLPTYKVDAYWKMIYQPYFAKSPIPAQLNDLSNREGAELNEAVARLLPQIRPEAGIPGWMIVERLLEVTPKLEETLAHEVLALVPKAVDEATTQTLPRRLLDRGMLIAAHFNDQTVLKTLANRFFRYSEKQQDRKSLLRMEQLAQGTFRSFSRLGMKMELEKFLSHLAEWVLRGESFPVARRRFGKEWPLALRILLPIAAGWYSQGLDEQGYTIIDLTGKDLYTVEMTPRERTDLALSYATTLGQIPVKIALGRFEELFQRLQGIQVKGTANTHFTLSILQLVETVVVSLVHPDFQLGPGVRRWLDEDEFRVRQRIHGELQKMINQQ